MTGSTVPDVMVAAAAVHVPGITADRLDATATGTYPPADEAHTLLGRKGLLFKEPAVRLALCAVHQALGLPPGRPTGPVEGAAGTAVVVSSNLGNVATVCDIVDQVRAGDLRGVSPMQAPNASSNIVASSIAIRYGFTGPNLMVCSGATGGLDALRLGALLIRSGRAHRAVVVGTEPSDDTAAGLLADADRCDPSRPLRAAAACVVLAAGTDAAAEIRLRWVRRHEHGQAPAPAGSHLMRVTNGPGDAGALDVSALVGDVYGASGVLQSALAARWLTDPASRPGGVADAAQALVTCGSPADGYASAYFDTDGGPR